MTDFKQVKSIGIIFLLFSTFSVHAQSSRANNQPVEREPQEVKCHVELLGGIETIYFVSTKELSLRNIANKIKGKQIITPLSENVATIYKVVECVKLYDDFTRLPSQNLDVESVR